MLISSYDTSFLSLDQHKNLMEMRWIFRPKSPSQSNNFETREQFLGDQNYCPLVDEPQSNMDKLFHQRYFSRQQGQESRLASMQSNEAESVNEKEMQRMMELFMQSAKMKSSTTPRDMMWS